jgi:hypothetical protein
MSYCRDIKVTVNTTVDAEVNVDADGDEFSKFQLERNLITTVPDVCCDQISLAAFYSNNCVRVHLPDQTGRNVLIVSPSRVILGSDWHPGSKIR